MKKRDLIWQERFELIEKAGGPKLPLIRTLSFKERLKMFNVMGFFFGPFYYFVKGMWKKA